VVNGFFFTYSKLNMTVNYQIKLTEIFVKENLKDYDSGHDWWHIERVRKLSAYINKEESLADPFIVDITALLHDTADSKFKGAVIDKGYQIIIEFLEKIGLAEMNDRILGVIKNISFSSRYKAEKSSDPLLWVIQDADRLDAIGAIGVARAFNYGGFRNNKIFDPETGTASTISHFYDKLLLLKGMMNTSTGKKLAVERHEYLETFLKQFYSEWDFGAIK
jgi:uncharacterized protein